MKFRKQIKTPFSGMISDWDHFYLIDSISETSCERKHAYIQ